MVKTRYSLANTYPAPSQYFPLQDKGYLELELRAAASLREALHFTGMSST